VSLVEQATAEQTVQLLVYRSLSKLGPYRRNTKVDDKQRRRFRGEMRGEILGLVSFP